MRGKPPLLPPSSFWLNVIPQSMSRQLDIEDKVLLVTSNLPCAYQRDDDEQGLQRIGITFLILTS